MNAPDTARPLLPARAQPLLAAVLAACLAGGAAWYVAVGGLDGGLVHHDVPPVRPATFTVDINSADEAELAQLPGLGPATARRIVDRRRDIGPFATIESLLDVPGIGPATLDAMRPHLRPVPAP